MTKVAIIYASIHHQNTKNLLDGIVKECAVDLFTVKEAKKKHLLEYNVIGLASGIYMAQCHKSLLDFLDQKRQLPQNAFIICTSGTANHKYIVNFSNAVSQRGLNVVGSYQCKGYDTYGLWKLMGGIAKGHPNEEDIANAIRFVNDTII